LKYNLNGLIRSTFHNSQLSQAGILNEQEFLKYYDQFQHTSAVPETDIARTLIAERWMQRTF
jgi:asparagine synthase (glutamine-hydrolysing)